MYLQSSIDQLSTLRCNGLSQQLQCTLSSSVMEGEILLFSLLNQNTLHSNERPNAPQTHNHYDYPVTLAALLTAPWPQVPPAATLLARYYMLTAPRLQVPPATNLARRVFLCIWPVDEFHTAGVIIPRTGLIMERERERGERGKSEGSLAKSRW